MAKVVEAAVSVRNGHYSIKTMLDRHDRTKFDEFYKVVDDFVQR